MTFAAAAVGAVRGFASRTVGPVCELCARPIDEPHRHAVDADLFVACVCDPCHLTLRNPSARWLGIDDHRRIQPVDPPATTAPVGVVYGVRLDDGSVQVRYPGPAGGQIHGIADDAWNDATASMQPRIDALVAVDGAAWIVPVDRVHHLAGSLRHAWVGMDGGPGARAVLDAFVADLAAAPGHRGSTG